MTAGELLSALRQAGIELTTDGTTLHYRAPRGAFTAELRATVGQRREELLAVLGDGREALSGAQAQALREVKANRFVYAFTLAAHPTERPIFLTPSATPEQARKELEAQHGQGEVLLVWPLTKDAP